MDRRKFIWDAMVGVAGISTGLPTVESNLLPILNRNQFSNAGSEMIPHSDPSARPSGAITLLFGVQEMITGRWDGSVTLSEGKILDICGYRFGDKDKILDNNSWHASTSEWLPSIATGDLNPREEARPHATRVKTLGITIQYEAPPTAKMSVTIEGAPFGYPVQRLAGSSECPFLDTPKKSFEFRIGQLPESGPLYLLDSRVQAFRVPVVEPVSDPQVATADYPSMALDQERNLWMAWVTYHKPADGVYLRQLRDGKWSEVMRVTPGAGAICSTAIGNDAKNRVWIVWTQRQGENWHLMARHYHQGTWGAVEQLTEGTGNNLFPRFVRAPGGELHLLWQGFRSGAADIFLRTLRQGSWSNEINLSDRGKPHGTNDWSPAGVVDHSGTLWVAWDSYAHGSYNILLRSVKDGRIGELLQVTDSRRFHAHANVAVDDQNRLWVAYDESDENWGKEEGYFFGGGTNLYQSRRIRFAIRSGNQWLQPRSDLDAALPYGPPAFMQLPRLIPDGNAMWVLIRSRTEAAVPMTHFAWGGRWELLLSRYEGDRWSRPVPIPESHVDRNQESPFDGVIDDKGQLLIGFAGKGIYLGCFSGRKTKPVDLGVRATEPPTRNPVESHEREDVAAAREYVYRVGGKAYKIYRGDMHRHTEISPDGSGDGSLWDAYRYALDAASLDFFAVTDHGAGGTEYRWWRTQKSSDMFHVPGLLLPLFGYERSIGYPNGHRNVVTGRRGVRVLPNGPREELGEGKSRGETIIRAENEMIAGRTPSWADQQIVRSEKYLYPYLRKNDAIAMAHTPANMEMGTDWGGENGTINIDPELEPLVEIFQGARISSEHEGAPLAPSQDNPELQHGEAGGYQRLGWIWNAWKKGYKLGVQSSSDHTSTHCSYTFVLAEEGTREGLMNAMRRRHTYAGTTNIILDFRLRNESGEYLMGDEVASRVIPTLRVKARGTGPIARVHIIRDNRYVHLEKGHGAEIEFTYRDRTLAPGEHYYYVRLEQQDGNVAWASPIWVKYQL